MIRTNGAEFKKFYSDANYWKNGIYHEEELIEVDGVELNADDDFNEIPDTAHVRVSYGVVYADENNHNELCSFESYFRKWRKEQRTDCFVVKCTKESSDELKVLIKAHGGQIQ